MQSQVAELQMIFMTSGTFSKFSVAELISTKVMTAAMKAPGKVISKYKASKNAKNSHVTD